METRWLTRAKRAANGRADVRLTEKDGGWSDSEEEEALEEEGR